MPSKGSRTGIQKECLLCGNSFYVHPAHVERDIKFCSRDCYLASFQKLNKKCPTCGKCFTVGLKLRDRKFCSVGCYSKTIEGRVLSESSRRKVSESKLGNKHPFWNGGVHKAKGRTYLLDRDHPAASGNYRYLPKARLVVEKHLGRTLNPDEIVHHRNEKKNDDRLENLMVLNGKPAHARIHSKHPIMKDGDVIFDGRNL